MTFGCGTGLSGEHDGAELMAGLRKSSKGPQTLLPPTTDVPHSHQHSTTQPVLDTTILKNVLQYL